MLIMTFIFTFDISYCFLLFYNFVISIIIVTFVIIIIFFVIESISVSGNRRVSVSAYRRNNRLRVCEIGKLA